MMELNEFTICFYAVGILAVWFVVMMTLEVIFFIKDVIGGFRR